MKRHFRTFKIIFHQEKGLFRNLNFLQVGSGSGTH
jgi:hypothetical protein